MKLNLDSGRIVRLSELHQRRTYAGLLAGRPDRRINEGLIEELTEEAKSYGPEGNEPFILVPAPALLEAKLPAIACVAVLESTELQGGTEPYSSMVFGWWQNEFAPLLPLDVERCIKVVDWEARAREWCP